MSKLTTSLVLLLSVFCVSNALQFSASAEIRKNNAVMKATFYYSDTLKSIRYDYTDPMKMVELYNFTEKIKYKYCSSCEAGFVSDDLPILYYLSTDSKSTSGAVTTYTRANNKVEYLKYISNQLSEFKWNGAVYKLSNYQTLSGNNKFKYTDFSSNCPRPVCKRVIDIIFVLDESGSIAEEEWEKQIQFCKDIVNSYEIGYDAAQVGIVGFCTFGVKYLDLSASKTTIMNKLNYILTRQHRGGTCTGCGLMIAKSMFDGAKNTQRTKNYNPEHLVITITDGGVADPDYYTCNKIYNGGSFYNFCVGCCSRKDPNRPYCWDSYSGTCTGYNRTFKLTGSASCNSRSECTKGNLNRDGFSCTGCWCDAACTTVVCDKCTVTGYSTRCRQMRYDVESCAYQNVPGNYYYTNFTNSVAQIKKDDRLLSIAIGVGSYSPSQLSTMATSLQGVQTVFGLSDYSKLNSILDKMISESCTKIEEIVDCSNCNGFCGCGRKCMCPTCEKYAETCVENKCPSPASGCLLSHIQCPNDLCNIPTKDNKTAGCCSYKKKVCDDHRYCTEDKCVPGTGCVFTLNKTKCDDGDGCTADKCDDTNGCSHTRLDMCNPPDKCQVVKVPCKSSNSMTCVGATFEPKCKCDDPCDVPHCNMETGECTCTPKDCSTNNSCIIGYCEDGVCLTKDNMTKINECHQMSTECSISKCQDGECVKEDIPCTACQNNPSFVSECEARSNACEKYKCKDIDGEPVCEKYWELKLNPDKCYGETCDPDTGLISNPMDLIKTENCTRYVCKDGGYEVEEKLCPENGNCYSYSCGEDNSCIPTLKCELFEDGNKCRPLIDCNEDDGCVYGEKTCESGNCFESFCNTETGECEKVDNSSNCDKFPDDKCILFSCDQYKGCVFEDVKCDDNDSCTIDYCDNGTCVYEPKCISDDGCQVASCEGGQCIFAPRVCPEPNSTCFVSYCEGGECREEFNTVRFLEICDTECIDLYGDLYNITKNDICIGALKRGEFAAAIGAAAVAGIVVAAIVVAAIVGISSSFGVRELIKRAKLSEDTGLNNNPLYEANDNEGTNPMFMTDDK